MEIDCNTSEVALGRLALPVQGKRDMALVLDMTFFFFFRLFP